MLKFYGITVLDCTAPNYSATARDALEQRLLKLALKYDVAVTYTTVM
jgi:hypothetical protein